MKSFIAILLVASLLLLSGCECLSGFGRDMQKAGRWVEEEAQKAR